MKILNINSYYYSSSVHRQLQKALQDMNLNATTYVPLAKGYVPREECLYKNEKNIDSYECYKNRDRYVFYVKHNKILDDILKRYSFKEYNCLHAHSLFSNGYIALKIKEKFGIPYIVTVRDTDLNTFFKYMLHLRRLGQKILKKANKIIFLSEPYRDFLIRKYISNKFKKEIFTKSEIIPNGIDEFWLSNKGYPKMLSKQKKLRLLYVGVVSRRKNITSTASAIEILQNMGYNIEFTVVGGVQDNSVYKKIKNLDYVTYIPPKSKKELIEIYCVNDIFVMPSITETFGLVYAEAMTQGLPVIYSKGQGFDRQFTEGEVGYSVNCMDANEIADRIIEIKENYNEISKRCIQLADRFDWNKIAQKYKKIYDECTIN